MRSRLRAFAARGEPRRDSSNHLALRRSRMPRLSRNPELRKAASPRNDEELGAGRRVMTLPAPRLSRASQEAEYLPVKRGTPDGQPVDGHLRMRGDLRHKSVFPDHPLGHSYLAAIRRAALDRTTAKRSTSPAKVRGVPD